jgi:hypothetical protein
VIDLSTGDSYDCDRLLDVVITEWAAAEGVPFACPGINQSLRARFIG